MDNDNLSFLTDAESSITGDKTEGYTPKEQELIHQLVQERLGKKNAIEFESLDDYCDTFGFKDVAFDPDKVSEMRPEKITVVYVEPGRLAKTTEIGSKLEDLQAAVGGCIEAFYPFEEVCIVCNDEGKMNGMKLNRGIYGDDGKLMDIIAGPFFVCDCSGENFGSLSKEQQERYEKLYKKPERFFKQNDEIIAVPYEPREKTNER